MILAQKSVGWYLTLRYAPESLTVLPRGAMPRSSVQLKGIFLDDGILNDKWRETIKECWALLDEGGILSLWLPDVTQRSIDQDMARITAHDIHSCFENISGKVFLEDDFIDGFMFIVLRKCAGKDEYEPWEKKKKHVLVMRTGAHGDALIASSIFPALVYDGWAIDVQTAAAGYEVLKNDPHINSIFQIYKNQITDEEQPHYIAALSKRYDRVINLTHSVEGELLKQPWRGDYLWPEDQRRRMCGKSYLAHTHEIAGVLAPFNPCFYPSPDEKDWALKKWFEIGKFILIQLSGSSVHKWYPHMAEVVVQLLVKTQHKIVLAGDKASLEKESQIIDAAQKWFGDASRIFSLVDVTGIRNVMALARHASAVIAPETGVLHAVCMNPAVAKICLLSHSAPSNLTDDWVNAIAVLPDSPCYPCHRLHYNHDFCPQDKATQAAACAASIKPQKIVEAALGLLNGNLKEKVV